MTQPLQEGVGPIGGNNEPTLAINPTNPYNIAINSSWTFSLSNDYGATFTNYSFAEPPGTGENNSGDVSMAFDSTGRLFATHISLLPNSALGDIIVNEVNPSTGAALHTYNATANLNAPSHKNAASDPDKEWIAVDHYANSPFRDRIYLAWGESAVEHAAYSADHGATWHFVRVADVPVGSSPGQITLPSEFPADDVNIGVSFTGDVYIAYQAANGGGNGTSDSVVLLRSTNGGQDFNQRTVPYPKGTADIPFNDPPGSGGRTIPHNSNFTAGSATAYVVPDTSVAGNVYVVAADDANNGGAANINVYMARSTDFGRHFTSPTQIDRGAGATSFFPTAAMDDRSGCLAITWWDNRSAIPSQVNASDYKLDLYVRGSLDHGATFGPEVVISDTPFDPDLNAPARGPGEYRIGEYNGLGVVNGVAYAAWTGNDPSSSLQQIMYDSARACNVPNEPPVQANVAAARQDPNITTVLTVGSDGAIWDRWVVQSGAWQGPVAQTATGLVAPGAQIALAPNGASELDAFFVDTQGQLREMTETNNGPWQLVSTPLTAAGSLASGARLATGLVNGNTRLVGFVDKTGALGGVFSVSGGTWTRGTLTGANFAPSGAPLAMGNQDSNQLDIFIIAGGSLKSMWFNGAWFGPIVLSSTNIPTTADIVTAMQGPAQLDVFFVGSNGAVQGAWSTKTGGIWGPWNANVNLTPTSYAPAGAGIAAAPYASNQLDVFFVNNSGALAAVWVATPGLQPWQGPAALSPVDYASPGDGVAAASQFGINQLDLFAAGKAGVIVTAAIGTGWSPTIALP